MSTQAPAEGRFHSDVSHLLRICVLMAAIGAPVFLVVTALGQVRGNRFPAYGDLLLGFSFPILLAAATAGLFWLAVRAFPVKILPDGLRCYDLVGRYRTVPWHAITAVESRRVIGLDYLYVEAEGLSAPLTLPLWLRGLPEFIALVEQRAGAEHVLARSLRAAA